MDRLVAIEGIDQSGKKSQTGLLERLLRRRNLKVGTISFPIYNSRSGRLIRAYLDGKVRLPFPAACMLYSLNRWEQLDRLRQLMAESDFVVANRYTPSGLAYGIAGGAQMSWLRALDEGLPRPKVVILLDVPVDTSFVRKKVARDIHESNAEYLRKVRRAYLKLARSHGWHVVDGTGSKAEVLERVRKHIRLV